MAHGRVAPGGIVAGIAVPGDNVHLLCPFEIVQPLIGAHQVGGDQGIGIKPADDVPLHFVVFKKAVGHKPAVIHRQACKGSGQPVLRAKFHAVSQGVGGNHLVPAVDAVPPEFQVPGSIQCIYGMVLLFQPDTEGLGAILTEAFPAVFVVYMPAGNMPVAAVAFGQLLHQGRGVFLINGRVWAGIVSLSEGMPASLVVNPCHFRVFLEHPGRQGGSGGCQDDVIIFPAQHVHDLVQLVKIIFFLPGLYLGPGKYIDGCTVDAGILEIGHILVPDLSGPLVGVVIPAIKNSFECSFHDRSSLLKLNINYHTAYRHKKVRYVKLNNITFRNR